jgi:hypothetical protein
MPKDKIENGKRIASKVFQKSILGPKYCHRCKRGGHAALHCIFPTDVNGHLIKGDMVERIRHVMKSGKIRREDSNSSENSVIKEQFPIENVDFAQLDTSNIESIKSCLPGIYEIALRLCTSHGTKKEPKIKYDEKLTVVYVGMSSDLRERLLDHFKGDRITQEGYRRISNIGNEIQDSRKKGYWVYYRYWECENEGIAKQLESDMLSRYDYAWNIEENDKSKKFIF